MIKIISVVLGLLVSQWAFSFGDLGHKAVAAIAWQHLTPFAKQNVERILGAGKQNFVKSSTWADHIKSNDQFDYLKPLHYVNMPKTAIHYQRSRDCKKDKCIVEAINMFGKVVKTGSRKEQLLALRMIVHLIADIHQPLHAGFKQDRGGNWYEVRYDKKAVSLHKLWDHKLVKRIADDWQVIADNVGALNIQVPIYTPKTWAEESHKITAEFVYQATENQDVSEEYLVKADAVLQEQLGRAGWRLAMWLNKLW